MEPMIKEDDLVLAKTHLSDPSDGSIAVIVHDEMPKIKKVSHIKNGYVLESLNKEVKSEYVTDEAEGLRIIGLVKGIIRKAKINS
jgi:phage repressor protein C with HTH and peptisase S24 domain